MFLNRIMSIKADVQKLSAKTKALKDTHLSEEATKNAFVIPMLSALGYDASNPKEVMPEMPCDISGKGDRVDYAVFKDDKPIFIVECKQADKNIRLSKGQLAKYYVATSAKYAILTNGLNWLFYADFDKSNIMDANPFFEFDITDYTDAGLGLLERFSQDKFDRFVLARDFARIYFSGKIKDFLSESFAPSEKFVRFVSESTGVADMQLCYDVISKELGKEHHAEETLSAEERDVILTLEKSVSDLVDPSVFGTVRRKDFLLLCKYGNPYRWVARIKIQKTKKQIGFPVNFYKQCEWHIFNTSDDIMKMKNLVVQALDLASFKNSRQQMLK